MQEFIKISISLLNDPLWEDKPFSKGQAWIDILLMSENDDDGFETSERTLSERWDWSRTKVRSFLDDLENYGKIKPRKKPKKNQKKTTIFPVKSMVSGDSKTKKEPKKDQEKNQDLTNENSEIYNRIVGYLNKKCQTNYSPKNEDTIGWIDRILRMGYREEDFYCVIDKKSDEWMGTEWQKFLRPYTLFGEKFEGYLNQKINKRRTSGKYCDFPQRDYDYDDLVKKLNES